MQGILKNEEKLAGLEKSCLYLQHTQTIIDIKTS